MTVPLPTMRGEVGGYRSSPRCFTSFGNLNTTSVYSGLLRMADLLALQPNMKIALHIVAPIHKREKVFQEIRRPVFSLLESGPLSEACTYLSYDALRDLASQKQLAHFLDTVLDEYSEDAE